MFYGKSFHNWLGWGILSLALPLQAVEKKIEDNSFLIEEAYNQETRMVQHIQNFQYLDDKTLLYTFTQEWPLWGMAHQASVTIPLQNSLSSAAMSIGDVALNYRYQLLFNRPVAIAPRLTILLPTGDYRRELGNGATGFQTNWPLSVELSERWVMHWNIGATYVPNAREAGGSSANILSFNYGMSLIWLTREDLNFMLELVGQSNESVLPGGSKERRSAWFVSPGMRFAVDFKGGLQMVPGIGVPIKFSPDQTNYGVFAYLSFEHPY